MILKLLWIKWNIQKTYFWCYFWINIIFKIIFVSLFWVHPCLIQKNLIPFPPKNSSPASENFPFPPLPLRIPKFLFHPQSRVGKTLCNLYRHFYTGQQMKLFYLVHKSLISRYLDQGDRGGSESKKYFMLIF